MNLMLVYRDETFTDPDTGETSTESVAYEYFKIYKPKSKGNTDLDDYDFGDDDEPEDDADVEDGDDEGNSKAKDETDSVDSDG